mgnify:CR=1 FL=1
MSMLGLVITRLRVKAISVISNAKALILRTLFGTTGVLTVIATLYADSLTCLQLKYAWTKQKCKVLRAQLITLVSSIKAVLITVKASLIQIGLRLATTVRQILRRAK